MKLTKETEFLVFCETLENPIGIDNPHPRFSWRISGGRYYAPQQSYRITVYENGLCVWDSGNVTSCDSVAIEYEGAELKSHTEYCYKVRCVLTDGSEYSAEGTFEMGLLEREDWQGDFLCYPQYEKRDAPVFITDMCVKGKIKKSRAYFCGLGYGELYINGKKTDKSLLDPAWTDFTRRILYRTFDITDMLTEGENRIRILLGDGWMAHNHKYFEVSRKPPLPWYHEPCFLLNIRTEYEDGHTEIFYPEESNCFANKSEIVSQNLFDGEKYSAPRACVLAEQEKNIDSGDGWVNAKKTEMSGKFSAQVMPPIKETETVYPIRITSIDAATYTVDLGINFSGYLEVTVQGARDSYIEIRHAEVAGNDDILNQENLRYAQATDTYILAGSSSPEIYSPRFTYHGFRFAEIKIFGRVKVLDIKGIRVNSAVKRIGKFECDSEMINRIYKMLINTELNNMHSLPTDCPQRDERLAWLNDSTMRLEQNVMNFDSQLFYEKWMWDMRDMQDKFGTGAVPDTCPYYYGLSPARWNATVFVALPYAIYLYYQDIQPVKTHWEAVLKYMEFQKTKLTDEGLINEFYVGEWCPPIKDSILEDRQSAFAKEISNQLATSCFYLIECRICAKMAELLGQSDIAKDFLYKADQIKDAVNKKFFDAEKGAYIPECQGNTILPLFLGLVPDGYRERVAKNLVSYIINKDNYHISTGSHTTRFLFEALTKIGKTDIAIRMLEEKSYPGFGYMLENGATSLWERWEKSFGFMTSHNHPMSGGFGVWFFKALGGVLVDINGCKNHLTISPEVPKKLNFVNCSRHFPTGEVISNWYRTQSDVHYDIEIPWNMSASVLLQAIPDEQEIVINGRDIRDSKIAFSSQSGRIALELGSGYWHIVVKDNQNN